MIRSAASLAASMVTSPPDFARPPFEGKSRISWRSHADAPAGRRQYPTAALSRMRSGISQTMWPVPFAVTRTRGFTPVPIVNGAAPKAGDAVTKAARSAARAAIIRIVLTQ